MSREVTPETAYRGTRTSSEREVTPDTAYRDTQTSSEREVTPDAAYRDTQTSSEQPDDVPPPLPSAPPPLPNWKTFPGQDPTASNASFFDSSSFLLEPAVTPVATTTTTTAERAGGDERRFERSNSMDELDEATQQRLETVRRKSAFLGLNVYETDEYKKIKQG